MARAKPAGVPADFDNGLLEAIASNTECTQVERQWANAALDRMAGQSVRGVVAGILLGSEDDPLHVSLCERIMSYDCLLCLGPFVGGEVALVWTAVHAVHRRCVEERLQFDEIPRDVDVPTPIYRLAKRGRLNRDA